jgi:hypothetical protein
MQFFLKSSGADFFNPQANVTGASRKNSLENGSW